MPSNVGIAFVIIESFTDVTITFNLSCPDHFNSEWLSKIKEHVSSDNWRLRVSNIKKVVEGLTDFYETVILLGPIGVTPDPLLIGKECDSHELGKLLQLLLGAAVNCDHKEEYIEKIMSLDTTTQLVVKNAIEEIFQPLEGIPGRNRSSTDSMSFLADSLNIHPVEGTPAAFRLEIKKLTEELTNALTLKEKMTQEMFDLRREVTTLRQETDQLNTENEKMTNTIRRLESMVNSSSADKRIDTQEPTDASLKDMFVNKLQAKIDSLTDELFKMENSKEELRIKSELLEKELMELKFKNEDLQRKANEARNLKDELDIQRQLVEKAEKNEATIELLKKKLEDAVEFKRQMRLTDEKNVTESKLKISLEEELRKNCHLKSQLENLKKTVSELTSSVAQLTHRAETSEFETRLIKEKYEALFDEKENLIKEISEYRRQRSNGKLGEPLTTSQDDDVLTNLNKEMETKGQEVRIQELEKENALLNKQLSVMTSNLDPSKDTHFLQQELFEYQQKVSDLEILLQKKEEEVTEMDNRYRKCVSKAKQVAKVLEPISMSSSNSSISSVTNFEQLALELSLKEKQIQELEAEHEKTKAFKEVEERLMSVAFHSLASKLQRTAAEERITGRNASGNGAVHPPHSFLSRQRQSTSRRFNISGLANQR